MKTKAKKPAKPATGKRPEKNAEPARGAVGARIRELIATRGDLDAGQIAEIVRGEFPGSRATKGSVRCYFTYMRADKKGPQPARDKS